MFLNILSYKCKLTLCDTVCDKDNISLTIFGRTLESSSQPAGLSLTLSLKNTVLHLDPGAVFVVRT